MNAFFSLLTGHGVSWIAKLLFVSILMAAWNRYGQPYQQEMVDLGRWMLAMSVFQVISLEQMQLVSDFITLIISWEVVSWILPHHKTVDPSSTPNAA